MKRSLANGVEILCIAAVAGGGVLLVMLFGSGLCNLNGFSATFPCESGALIAWILAGASSGTVALAGFYRHDRGDLYIALAFAWFVDFIVLVILAQ